MKKTLCYLFLSTLLLLNCKKDADFAGFAPKPQPEPEVVINADYFLKELKVNGSTAIRLDSLRNNFMVSLPDSYNEENAEVKLSLKPGRFLTDGRENPVSDSIIHYKYKGTNPLEFQLTDEKKKYSTNFTVYFNFTGTPDIKLLEKEIAINASGIKLPLVFNAKVGSIPASPEQSGPVMKFINRKTGFVTEASFYGEGGTVYAASAENLISNDPIALEIKFYNQNPVVFEGIKFLRALPEARIYTTYTKGYTYQDTVRVTGGYFVPDEKYTVAISNDVMGAPVTTALKFNTVNTLTVDKLPSTLPEGSYLFSFFEKDKLIGKASTYVSDKQANFLETIWKGSLYENHDRNVNRLSFNKGEAFYAKSIPLEFGTSNTNFDIKKLPHLRLKSPSKTIDLAPEMDVYSWGIAGVSYSLGKYTIPADLASGYYQVTAIYADQTESKPYWSKLEVR
jgi:hypothetical protein